jgi:hypothetical protein
LVGYNPDRTFVFGSYIGVGGKENGVSIILGRSVLVVELYEENRAVGSFTSRKSHNGVHSIPNTPSVYQDFYINLTITFDHRTNFITSYINGVLNESGDASTGTVPDIRMLDGIYFGDGPTDSYINRSSSKADGNVLMNDFKYFDDVLTADEIRYYRNERF